MKKRATCLACAALLTAAAANVEAADTSYIAARAGVFMPNGQDGSDYNSLKYFDNGYSVEVAAGYRPESYVAIEVGTGLYGASGKKSDSNVEVDRSFYAVPITLTVKGILDFDRIIFSGGAGLGYYTAFMDSDLTYFNTPVNNVSESNHGGAVGYQVVLDAEYKISDRWLAGADFKWFSARPKIELVNPDTITSQKEKWEIGGIVMHLGVKYLF